MSFSGFFMSREKQNNTVKGVLYGMFGPDLVGLTVAV